MAAHKQRALDWFERSGCTYWKLFPNGSRDMLERYWPAKDNEEASANETPEAAADALDIALDNLEPGRYVIKACASSKPKDASSYFNHTFTVPKSGPGEDPARRDAPSPMGLMSTGIFGHPDVVAHLKQQEAMAELKLQLAILNLKMQNGDGTGAPPSVLEKAFASFFGSLAPYAPALVSAFNGGQVPPSPSAQQAAPVGGGEDEAAIVENSLTRIKKADGDYYQKLKKLADYAEKNPAGFNQLMGSVDMLAAL